MSTLNIGDVIRIEEDMRVAAYVPEKFVYSTRVFSERPTRRIITVGELLNSASIKEFDRLKDRLKREVIRDFDGALGIKVNPGSVKHLIDINTEEYTPEELNTNIFIGEYVVVNVFTTIPRRLDISKLSCRKLDQNNKINTDSLTINFYDGGRYRNTIEGLEAIDHIEI
jgi:hypothetical protein